LSIPNWRRGSTIIPGKLATDSVTRNPRFQDFGDRPGFGHNSSIILLATSETRTLSLLALDQVASGYREVASITVILIMLLTLGVALIARSFGLKVGIRAD
jgi:hypothetical protein